MAHYALLDSNFIVVDVITGIDENETQVDLDGTVVGGSSEAWENFYASRPWFEGLICKRTSYNTVGGIHNGSGIPYRNNYAGIGYLFREDVNSPEGAFVPPCPGEEYVLDENTGLWVIINGL